MIRSESEYREALGQVQFESARLAQLLEKLHSMGLSKDQVEDASGPVSGMLEVLRNDINQYDRILSGDLKGFRILRDLGRLLIGGRLARKLSQRELAQRNDSHESQVSRDERNEYQGITLERYAQLAQSLGLDIRLDVRLLDEAGVDSSEGGIHFDVPPLSPSLSPEMNVAPGTTKHFPATA